MKQKYINANIYRHDKATEFIVENGRFSAIGTDLGHADEIIDVKGKLILPPMLILTYTWIIILPVRQIRLKTKLAPYSKLLIFGMTLKKAQPKRK